MTLSWQDQEPTPARAGIFTWPYPGRRKLLPLKEGHAGWYARISTSSEKVVEKAFYVQISVFSAKLQTLR